ncbi:MAG TPA: hypothetical protein VI006_14440 [Solirubrobacteraceae bacterium]
MAGLELSATALSAAAAEVGVMPRSLDGELEAVVELQRGGVDQELDGVLLVERRVD